MNKIIVPVDFSDFSEHALETAAYFAKKHKADILVVHLIDLPTSLISKSSASINEESLFKIKLAEKNFKNFLNKDYLKGIKVKPIIKGSKDFKELNNVALKEGADLIIMGSHGVYGLKEILIGSNTEKVVRNSKIPVLITKGVAITSNLESAVFGCDFSNDDIEPYLKAKELLKTLGCQIQLLHVNTPNSKFISTSERYNKALQFIEKSGDSIDDLNNVAFTSEYSIEEGILDFANTHGKDLIIMATHGKKGIEHFLDGSISEDVANHATLPVLTFRI